MTKNTISVNILKKHVILQKKIFVIGIDYLVVRNYIIGN